MKTDLAISNYPVLEIESLPEYKIQFYCGEKIISKFFDVKGRLFNGTEIDSNTPNINKYFGIFNENKHRQFLHDVQKYRTIQNDSLQRKFEKLLKRKSTRKLRKGFSLPKYLKTRLIAKDKYVDNYSNLHEYKYITLHEFMQIIKKVPAIDRYVTIIPLNNLLQKGEPLTIKEYFASNKIEDFILSISQKTAPLLYHYNIQVLHDERLKLYIKFLMDLFMDIDFNDTRTYDEKIKSYIHFLYEKSSNLNSKNIIKYGVFK